MLQVGPEATEFKVSCLKSLQAHVTLHGAEGIACSRSDVRTRCRSLTEQIVTSFLNSPCIVIVSYLSQSYCVYISMSAPHSPHTLPRVQGLGLGHTTPRQNGNPYGPLLQFV